jgi:hypothetical protein
MLPVIRVARTHTDEIGCVLEADIYQPGFDFTGVKRLKHHPDEELLLRALVQTFLDHSLCIAEDSPHGRHLVFPSHYRRKKNIPHEPDIFVPFRGTRSNGRNALRTPTAFHPSAQGCEERATLGSESRLEQPRSNGVGIKRDFHEKE